MGAAVGAIANAFFDATGAHARVSDDARARAGGVEGVNTAR
jgi:hypothetical protein